MTDKIPEISKEKQKLLFRIKRIRGQFAAVERALTAMAATMVIGLILGAMARRMLDENLAVEKEKLKKHAAPAPPDDR